MEGKGGEREREEEKDNWKRVHIQKDSSKNDVTEQCTTRFSLSPSLPSLLSLSLSVSFPRALSLHIFLSLPNYLPSTICRE